jgi:hypothetical protein
MARHTKKALRARAAAGIAAQHLRRTHSASLRETRFAECSYVRQGGAASADRHQAVQQSRFITTVMRGRVGSGSARSST